MITPEHAAHLRGELDHGCIECRDYVRARLVRDEARAQRRAAPRGMGGVCVMPWATLTIGRAS